MPKAGLPWRSWPLDDASSSNGQISHAATTLASLSSLHAQTTRSTLASPDGIRAPKPTPFGGPDGGLSCLFGWAEPKAERQADLLDVADVLTEANADPLKLDTADISPLDLAHSAGNSDLVRHWRQLME